MNIIFVCYANLCRSPLAEGIFKQLLERSGKSDIIVSSAGIRAYEGSPPHSKSIQVAKERGIDISGYGGVQLTKEMVKDADLILTLDDSVKHHILSYYTTDSKKIYTLKECAGEINDLDVEDPYGLSTEAFRRCADEIEEYSAKILAKLDL
ncbi:MAG: low molecular weight protein arginine phosphatase [Promethearchaeota archaeon]